MRLRTRGLAALSFGLASSVSLLAQPPGIPPVPVPFGNPITVDKANLGKTLFFDEQLSTTGTVACATCHLPASGGSDPRSTTLGAVHPGPDGQPGTPDDISASPGVTRHDGSGAWKPDAVFGFAPQVTGRKAPSVVLAAYSPGALFWDGRATGRFVDPITGSVVLQAGAALESQAAGPPLSDVEMAHEGRDWNQVAAAIAIAKPLALASNVPAALSAWLGASSYPQLFARAFGDANVTPARILLAIATYQRTLVANQAPFDAFLAGNPNALTQQQQRGFQVFTGPGRCAGCHSGPLMQGPAAVGPEQGQLFVNIGVRPPGEDLGRGAITGLAIDDGRFKIPSLRNVGLRAPYFHNGSKQTLLEVVDFYNRGGDFPQNQSPQINPLGLSPMQRNDLVAFLQGALTDPRVATEQAPFDRPRLYSESSNQPVSYGLGGPGSGGAIPQLLASEPPMLGNAGMTIGMFQGLGGAGALLLLGVGSAPPGTMFLGAPLHVDPARAMLAVAFGNLTGVGPGAGYASVGVAIPTDPQLAGQTLFLQGGVADSGAPQGLATSPGVRLTLFAPQ